MYETFKHFETFIFAALATIVEIITPCFPNSVNLRKERGRQEVDLLLGDFQVFVLKIHNQMRSSRTHMIPFLLKLCFISNLY